jgi:hypothetical protein
MKIYRPLFPVFVVLFFLVLAVVQLLVLPRDFTKGDSGSWFLYGRDTVTQDAIQQLWAQKWIEEDPGGIPLWISEVQGGIPTVGSFFWTPFAPNVWTLYAFPWVQAQKIQWILALWWAGIGGYLLGRKLKLRQSGALYTGLVWMLSGHVVTLIHAGHSQKVFALSWLPWMVAAFPMIADQHVESRRWRGVALGGFSFGMMFYCGHPQIAYTGAVLGGLYALWTLWEKTLLRLRWKKHLALFLGMIVVGGIFSSAQLLPGMEMSKVSNRSGGVGYEEAVETSYPPAELLELVVPRCKGSNVFGDVYTGDWGERIVSDYVGKLTVLLSLVAVFGFYKRSKRIFFWVFICALFLLVGVGKYTPFYGILYEFFPGFASFRSPGTFMCAACLALAVLSGYGMTILYEWMQNTKRGHLFPLVSGILVLLTVADLAWANRFFLIKDSWSKFSQGYLAPTELDVWLDDEGLLLENQDVMTEMRLRPILYGNRALNGYYPINYMMKTDRDQALGFNTPKWFKAWGITRLQIPTGNEPAEDVFTIEKRFPAIGRDILKMPGPGVVALKGSTDRPDFEWSLRSPNEKELVVDFQSAGTLQVKEIVGAGHQILVNDELVTEINEPALSSEVELSAGQSTVRWIYKPFSWSLGVFLAAMGAMLLAFAGVYGQRKVGYREKKTG